MENESEIPRDPKYCTSLVEDTPKRGETGIKESSKFLEGQAAAVSDTYLCGITGKPCIARKVRNVSESYDVFLYNRTSIDVEKLPSCPAWNAPRENALELLEMRIKNEARRQISLFNERLEVK